MPPTRPPRLAVRAIILRENRLLLVNAWAGGQSDLLCAPGGGVEPHASLHDNLRREVFEETGLRVQVGIPCLVNEFHAPERNFHQVDIYFRCEVLADQPASWTDPEGVVTERRWVSRDEFSKLRIKPDSLAAVAWADEDAIGYDPLELLVR